jgi:hypothetical protein
MARGWRRRHVANHALLPLVFDAGWYATRYRDVFKSGLDPLEHYLGPGSREGRDPAPHVDISFLALDARFTGVMGLELLCSVLDAGLPEGLRTSPYVDLEYYAKSRTDAPRPAIDPVGTLEHLLRIGLPAGASPSPYVDLSWFVARYPDLQRGSIDPFDYFVALGGPLGRFPHPLWDETSYREDNEYVRFSLGMGKHLNGFEHFCAFGAAEVAAGLSSLLVHIGHQRAEYVEERYLAANPDVADLIARGDVSSGVEHLFDRGHRDVAAGSRRLAPATNRSQLTRSSAVTARPVQRDPSDLSDVLILLVHFDVDGLIDEHVLHAIDAYRANGCDVCFIGVDLDPTVTASLEGRGVAVLHRVTNDNLRDFGAWALALDRLGEQVLQQYEIVVLANDSAYFPVCDPTDFFAELRATDCDVWAATDSFSGGRYHLQSYFIALRAEARQHFAAELARLITEHPDPSKILLIQRFEVGLTTSALQRGFKVGAFRSIGELGPVGPALLPPDPRPLGQLAITLTNPTHHFWRATWAARSPFLKVELLRDNPVDVDVDEWSSALVDAPLSIGTIRAHLARVKR